MFKRPISIVLLSLFFVGCASVPIESEEKSSDVKKFRPPTEGYAGLYIYRKGDSGRALKKDIWVNGDCIGESAPDVFFYEEVKGDEKHRISTESEFSRNDLIVKTKSGRNYFVRQYVKPGIFVGGAALRIISEGKGMEDILKLDMAKKGKCSSE